METVTFKRSAGGNGYIATAYGRSAGYIVKDPTCKGLWIAGLYDEQGRPVKESRTYRTSLADAKAVLHGKITGGVA